MRRSKGFGFRSPRSAPWIGDEPHKDSRTAYDKDSARADELENVRLGLYALEVQAYSSARHLYDVSGGAGHRTFWASFAAALSGAAAGVTGAGNDFPNWVRGLTALGALVAAAVAAGLAARKPAEVEAISLKQLQAFAEVKRDLEGFRATRLPELLATANLDRAREEYDKVNSRISTIRSQP